MPSTRTMHPTELELQVLKVLWRDGPATVRHVRHRLGQGGRKLAYTSVMTVMTIMTRKRLLSRKKRGLRYVYSPRVSEQQTTASMLQTLVDRAFDGSAAAAMLSLIDTTDLDPAELCQLRAMIDRKSEQR